MNTPAPSHEEREDFPHVQAAFINALAEEGTREELVTYLQKTWNELCFVKAQRDAANGWNFNMEDAPRDGTKVDLWCERENYEGEITHVRKCNACWGARPNRFTGGDDPDWLGIYELFADITPIAFKLIDIPEGE